MNRLVMASFFDELIKLSGKQRPIKMVQPEKVQPMGYSPLQTEPLPVVHPNQIKDGSGSVAIDKKTGLNSYNPFINQE
jgi:hypothetical protein